MRASSGTQRSRMGNCSECPACSVSPRSSPATEVSGFEGNRVVADTGSQLPIFNAPIGFFARAGLAGAVSAAGGMGLLETASQNLEGVEREYDAIRAQTD